MRSRTLAALTALGAVALAPAAAAGSTKATTYRGTIRLAGADGAYTGSFGTATLVDARRDTLTVQARRFPKRKTFRFRLVKGTCGRAARAKTVRGFKVTRALRTDRRGRATGIARARAFAARRGARYAVVISRGTGPVAACAQLKKR